MTTWSERCEQTPWGGADRAGPQATGRAGQRRGPLDPSAAAEFGVGWHTANAAVAEHTDPVIEDPARFDGVTAIGVDEKRFLNATPIARTKFTTQVVDLDRHRVLDVIEGRSRAVLGDWLAARGKEWCARSAW